MFFLVNNGGDGGKVIKFWVGKGKSRCSFVGEFCVMLLVCYVMVII